MHRKILLAAQVIVFVTSLSQAALPVAMMGGRGNDFVEEIKSTSSKSFALVNDTQIRDYVKQNISQIEMIAKSNRSSREKLAFIQGRVQRVSEFRAKHWSKSAFVEYDLDMTIKPFESFPSAQNFSSDRCQQYESTLINDWEPQAPDMKPSQRGVSNALAILKKICS